MQKPHKPALSEIVIFVHGLHLSRELLACKGQGPGLQGVELILYNKHLNLLLELLDGALLISRTSVFSNDKTRA